jgi:hypothetical protein
VSLQIVLNQSGKPAGVDGQAREDLDVGTAVTAACVGGPFLSYQWSFVSKPINMAVDTMANPLFGSSSASSTTISPIVVPGTYEIELAVDSGSGLGALDSDVVRITFYAGDPADATEGAPNADPAELPRRWMAFSETTEHNVPDAVEPTGNTEGWSREQYRWRAVIERMYQGKSWAHGRVSNASGTVALVNGMNITPTWLSVGRVQLDFTRPMPDGNYSVICSARGAPGGSATSSTETTTSFIIERADAGGSLVDADFTLDVKWMPG